MTAPTFFNFTHNIQTTDIDSIQFNNPTKDNWIIPEGVITMKDGSVFKIIRTEELAALKEFATSLNSTIKI